MNIPLSCLPSRGEIDAWLATGAAPGAGTMAHLQECAECRHQHAEAELGRLLQAHAVPPARPGFADEAILSAIGRASVVQSGRRRGMRWLGAIAASVAVIAVVLGTLVATGPKSMLPAESVAQVVILPLQSKIVQVLIDSADDRDSALITISLADNLELEGFPDERVIEWNTPLKAGKNLLALPLRLTDDAPSHFDVAFSHGEVRKKVRIDVSVAEPGPLA